MLIEYNAPLLEAQASSEIENIVTTTDRLFQYIGTEGRADPVTKELLIRELEGFEIKSYTNLFDAIELALTLGIDEVFVISDGEPNRGRKQLPRDILNELERINKRKIPIHTVSVVRTVDGDDHEPLLKRIADQTGGTYQERTLR